MTRSSLFRTGLTLSALALLAACSDSPTAPRLATLDDPTPTTPRTPPVDTAPFRAATLLADSSLVALLTAHGAGSSIEAGGDELARSFRPVRDTVVSTTSSTGTVIRGDVRAAAVRTGTVEATFRITRTSGRDARLLSVAIPIAMRLDEAVLTLGQTRRNCALDSTATTYAVRCLTVEVSPADTAVVTIRGTQRTGVLAPVAMTAVHGAASARLPITAIATNAELGALDLTTPGVVDNGDRVAIGLNLTAGRADTITHLTALVALVPTTTGQTLPTGLTPEGVDGRFNPGQPRACVSLITRTDIAIWRCSMDGGARIGLTRLTVGGRFQQDAGAVVQDYRVIAAVLSVDGIRHTGIERFAQTSFRLRR